MPELEDTDKILEELKEEIPTINKPTDKPKKELTEEQRKNRLQQLAKAREKKTEIVKARKIEMEKPKQAINEEYYNKVVNHISLLDKKIDDFKTLIEKTKEDKPHHIKQNTNDDLIEKTNKEMLLKQLREEQALRLRRELFSYS